MKKKYGIYKKETVTVDLFLTAVLKSEHVLEHIFDSLYRNESKGVIGLRIDGLKEESFSDDKWQRVIELFPERLMRGLYLEGGVKDES